jgi:hypothetical protein
MMRQQEGTKFTTIRELHNIIYDIPSTRTACNNLSRTLLNTSAVVLEQSTWSSIEFEATIFGCLPFLYVHASSGREQRLRHWTTNRKVARSNPDGVGFFHWHNPSGRTMALGSTKPLTEMSTRNISWGGKGGRCVGLTTLPPSCADCREIWEPQPPRTLRACNGIALPF